MFKEIVSATVARYIVVDAGEDLCDDCLLSCENRPCILLTVCVSTVLTMWFYRFSYVFYTANLKPSRFLVLLFFKHYSLNMHLCA